MVKKPYQQIPIVECKEPLVPIPLDLFAVESPHPYQHLGAPYGNKSPFFLRQGVLDRLILAQTYLQELHRGWRIQIFDAYRPIAVQQFMVDYTFETMVKERGLHPDTLAATDRQAILEQVYQFWAVPSLDPTTPPPHSTGAAVDVTLVDENDRTINMGSPIDEVSPRSFPDHFANCAEASAQRYHAYRQLLSKVMNKAGFERHPNEWWHFSLGDQMWVWLTQQKDPDILAIARYGGCE